MFPDNNSELQGVNKELYVMTPSIRYINGGHPVAFPQKQNGLLGDINTRLTVTIRCDKF